MASIAMEDSEHPNLKFYQAYSWEGATAAGGRGFF